MKVTFVIPTLDEEAGIGRTIDDIDREAFAARGWEVDVLVVDGESKDRTREEAEKRGAHVVSEPRRGYGRAYKTGFDLASGDVVVTGDADGTYPFDIAHDLVEALVTGDLDFITCDRYADLQPGAMTSKHRLGNWVLSTTLRMLFWVGIHDSQSGMWVLNRRALKRIPYHDLSDGMAFSQEIKIEAMKRRSVRAAEVPGQLHPRIGEAKIETWGDGLRNLQALYTRRLRGRSPRD